MQLLLCLYPGNLKKNLIDANKGATLSWSQLKDEADIIVAQGAKTGFPALAIIELDREASVVGKLTAAGHNPQIFRHTHGIAVYVE